MYQLHYDHIKNIFFLGFYILEIWTTLNSNKSVVGKMEDETAGVASEEFVGLKPKMHSYLVDDLSEPKKEKGVKKTLLQQ